MVWDGCRQQLHEMPLVIFCMPRNPWQDVNPALRVLGRFLLVTILLYVVDWAESSVSPGGSCFQESHLFHALCAVPRSGTTELHRQSQGKGVVKRLQGVNRQPTRQLRSQRFTIWGNDKVVSTLLVTKVHTHVDIRWEPINRGISDSNYITRKYQFPRNCCHSPSSRNRVTNNR